MELDKDLIEGSEKEPTLDELFSNLRKIIFLFLKLEEKDQKKILDIETALLQSNTGTEKYKTLMTDLKLAFETLPSQNQKHMDNDLGFMLFQPGILYNTKLLEDALEALYEAKMVIDGMITYAINTKDSTKEKDYINIENKIFSIIEKLEIAVSTT